MLTEIQLTDNRLHFMYLQRVTGEIAGSAGMSRREAEDMWKAISEVCRASLNLVKSSPEKKISVMLSANESCMTAEIVDCNTIIAPTPHGECFYDNGYSDNVENARRLVDSLEITRGIDETTIRLVKMADQRNALELSRPTVPVAG